MTLPIPLGGGEGGVPKMVSLMNIQNKQRNRKIRENLKTSLDLYVTMTFHLCSRKSENGPMVDTHDLV